MDDKERALKDMKESLEFQVRRKQQIHEAVPIVNGGASTEESGTPRTDEVLRTEDNHGRYPGSDDGVTPQEAHDAMVSNLARLASRLERELTAAKARIAELEQGIRDEAFKAGAVAS